jgi:hypothetical protein
MQWPPIGIGVSTGTAWGASIDPTTLQGKLTLTTIGTSGAATLTGNALNVPQYTAPAQVYPGAGIAVSTGSAWGAPLDPANLANVAYINKANTFTANQTVNGTLTSTGAITGGGFLAIPAINIQRTDAKPAVPAGTAILRTGVGGTPNLVLSAPVGAGIFLNFDQGTGVNFCDGAGTVKATIDSAGNASFNGNVSCNLMNVAGSTWTKMVFAQAYDGAINPNNAGISMGLASDNASAIINIKGNFGTANQSRWQMVCYANSMNWTTVNDAGAVGTNFFSVARSGAAVTAISIYGPTTVTGAFTVTGGAKTFRCTHPLDETKYLYHACLEGPENGVFYRGEAVIVDGYAVVTLPDYFEALTFPEDRSVQLTQVWEDTPVFARFAASRVVDGQFTIHATENVTIAWEVKAIRRLEVERLQVETKKPIEPEVVWNGSTDTDRSGTPEDGKPKSKKVRS